MQTIHLTEHQVDAYLYDLLERLDVLAAETPTVYVMIGDSGHQLGKRLLLLYPKFTGEVVTAAYERETDVVTFPHEQDVGKNFEGKRILVIDGTIHSGSTLIRVVNEIQQYNPESISCYCIAVRRGAKIIPNHFGFLIGDHDRVLFPRKTYCNSRLYAHGIHRKLSEGDLAKPMIKSGRAFIDDNTWDYHWYEVQTGRGQHVYVYEIQNQIKGFVSFRYSAEDKTFCIDDVAVDESIRSKKIGSFLLRWAEHWARHANCPHIELWAVDNLVGWYQRKGYKSENVAPLSIYGTLFRKMTKKTLYNLPDEDNRIMGL